MREWASKMLKGRKSPAKWRALYVEENHLVMEPIEAFSKTNKSENTIRSIVRLTCGAKLDWTKLYLRRFDRKKKVGVEAISIFCDKS